MKDVEIEIWDYSRVVGRVVEVDFDPEIQCRFGGSQHAEIVDFRIQVCDAFFTTFDRGCNLVS